MSMYINPEVFGGYPYPQTEQVPVIGLSVPHPVGMWLTDPDTCSGYPYHLYTQPIVPSLQYPYPAGSWCVDGYTNGGYPFLWRFRKSPELVILPKIRTKMRLYDKMETDFSKNGTSILMPTSCEIAEELNGAYEMTQTHPQDPEGIWKNIVEFRLVKALGQVFRIYCKETDLSDRKINARHLFYDLNAHFIKSAHPTELSGEDALEWIMDNTYTPRGAAAPADRPPFVVHSDIEGMHTAYYEKMSPTCAILGADNSFLNVWGGELKRDNFNIYINQHRGQQNAFRVRYGCDLTEITETVDCSDYCPCVYWEATVGGVENAKRGVASFVQLKLPIQPMQYLAITVDESITGDEAVNGEIARQIKEYVSGHCMPLVNYKIGIADIRNLPGYEDFVGLESYDVGDVGTIYSETLGISTTQQIVKRTVDGITGEVISIELGNLKKSIVSPSGRVVGTYQFEDAQVEAAAENTWGKLGAKLYTWDELKTMSWDEASGKVMIKYE